MKDNLVVFLEKFNVPERLKNQIYKILNEEEIILLNCLADGEERISDIIDRFPSVEFSFIESLYKRGYLIKQLKKSGIHYKSSTFDQILKRFVNHSPKYQKLSDEEKIQFQECINGLYLEKMRASKKPVYRVVPIGKTIQDKRQLIPYHQAVYYLKTTSSLTLIDCICRTTFNRCDKPRKVCLALGEQAEFFINRGIGEKISVRRGLDILDMAEKSGLVHSIDNKDNPNFLCHCCECCCVFVQGLKKHGIFTSIGKSGFVAILDSELCNQCGICFETCIFGAISDEKESIRFDKNKCFGCGLCAYFCPQEAINLILQKNENRVERKNV